MGLRGGGAVPLSRSAGNPSNTMWPARTDMGRKLGAVPPFGGGGAGSPFNTVALAEAYLHTKWHLSTCGNLATTDMDEKLGSVPLWGGKL